MRDTDSEWGGGEAVGKDGLKQFTEGFLEVEIRGRSGLGRQVEAQ